MNRPNVQLASSAALPRALFAEFEGRLPVVELPTDVNGAVAVGADALGERFVSIVTKLQWGSPHMWGSPAPGGVYASSVEAAAPGAAGATRGLAGVSPSVLFSSFESPCRPVFAGMSSSAGSKGDREGEREGERVRHAYAPRWNTWRT